MPPKADKAFCRVVAPARVREIQCHFASIAVSVRRAHISRLCMATAEAALRASHGSVLPQLSAELFAERHRGRCGLALCLFVGQLCGLRLALAGLWFLIVGLRHHGPRAYFSFQIYVYSKLVVGGGELRVRGKPRGCWQRRNAAAARPPRG